MKKLLLSILFTGALLTSKAQAVDTTTVQEKPTPSYFKHGLGFTGEYSLGYGLSYRHNLTKRFGMQGVFGFDSGKFINADKYYYNASYGLAFLYAIHRGHRMTYYAYQSNKLIRGKSRFNHNQYLTGVGFMAEIRVQDRIAVGLMTDVLYDVKWDRIDFSIIGMSFLYNF